MKTKKLVVVSLLVALSVVGSFIKIPSPTGTIALDSLPGYLGAAILPLPLGAAVGALGHLISALTVSFPLGFPLHLFIALQMAVYVGVFGYLNKKGYKIMAIIIAVILNGLAAPALLIPIMGAGIFWALLLPLIAGSAVNIILAAVLAGLRPIQRVGGSLDN